MLRVLEDRAGRLRDVPGRHKCGHAAQLTLWLKPTGGGRIASNIAKLPTFLAANPDLRALQGLAL
jgi:hypothetical protein